MTESEAKERWCPMVRHYNAQHAPCGNSLASMPNGRGGGFANCIGSACMMWKWEDHQQTFDDATPESPEGRRLARQGWKFIGMEGGMGCLMVWEYGSKHHGHCGLAGKP